MKQHHFLMPYRHSLSVLSMFIALSVIITGCATKVDENADVEALKTRRDSLKQVMGDLGAELQSVESQIAELAGDQQVIQVTTYETTSDTFEHFFTVQGNVETNKNALLYPETQGVVQSISVVEGQMVSKGQNILTLDTELVASNIQEVQTQYELARDVFERQERLWAQEIGSEMQFLEAKNNMERLENSLATLNKQLRMGSVKAPFDGVVDQVMPHIGEMANPGMPVARIISLKNMFVRAQVSEHYVNVVKEGMPVEVVLPGADTLKAAIKRVGKFINPENRTFEVTVDLEDPEKARPNMFCALRINDLKLDSVVTLPTAMVQQDTQNREFVYLLKENGDGFEVQKQLIETGASYGDRSWISQGLSPGMRIIDKGARRVNVGQEVALFSSNQ